MSRPFKGHVYLGWDNRREYNFEMGRLSEDQSLSLKHSCNSDPSLFEDEQLINGDTNLILEGDNLRLMNYLSEEEGFDKKVDLILTDPPMSEFGYERYYDLDLKDGSTEKVKRILEPKGYMGLSNIGEYHQFCLDRFQEIHRLLSPQGNLLLICDHKIDYCFRVILDEIFGHNNYVNQISWNFPAGSRTTVNKLAINHYSVIWYRKSSNNIFNPDPARRPYTEEQLKYFEKDEQGYFGYTPSGVKKYKHPGGPHPSDVWDFSRGGNKGSDIGYPGQRPTDFLEQLIETASEEDSIVLDIFGGSGSTGIAADDVGRRWIMCDRSKNSIHTMIKRFCSERYSNVSGLIPGQGFKHYRIDTIGEPKKEPGQLSVEVEIEKDDVKLSLTGYKHSDLNYNVKDFKSLIDYVLIDTNHNGQHFDIEISDCPIGRSEMIEGIYKFPYEIGSKIGIKVVDIFGNVTYSLIRY